MRELVHVAAFWVVVVVAVRAAVCFPDSLLARVLFSRLGPAPIRSEPPADYLVRCARFDIGWCLQTAILYAAGWVALWWDAALADSLPFLVLWKVILPLLGGCAMLAALFAFARAAWLRRFGRTVAASNSADRPQPGRRNKTPGTPV